MLPFEIPEVVFDFLHLCFYVAIGIDDFGANDAFLPVIQSEEEYGQLGLQRDVVEAALPFLHWFACAFGRDTECEGLAFYGSPCQLIREAHVFLTLHRDTSHATEQRAKWPEEPLLFHHELTAESFGIAVKLSHQEIPVACVRSQCDDVFVGEAHTHVRSPPHQVVEQVSAESLHKASGVELRQVIDMVYDLIGTHRQVFLQLLEETAYLPFIHMAESADEVLVH